MFGNLPAGEISVQPSVPWVCHSLNWGGCDWLAGGLGKGWGTQVWEGLQAPDFILNYCGRNWSLSGEQSQVVQVWPPREADNEESPLETWRFFQNLSLEDSDFMEPPLSLSLTRFGSVWVGLYFWAEPAPGRQRKPHDGKEGFGRKFFSVCFEQRSEIITALPLFCQSCLKFVAVNSLWFILSDFLSDLDLRTISSWHLLISDGTTVINPGFLLPPWSLLMLLNPRSLGDSKLLSPALSRACAWIDRRLIPMGFHNFLIYCLSAFITLFFKLKLPPDGVCDTDLLICNKTSLITCTAAHSSFSEGGIISLWMSQEWKRVVNFLPLLPVWFLPRFPCFISGHLQGSRWEHDQFWAAPRAPSVFRWDSWGWYVQGK